MAQEEMAPASAEQCDLKSKLSTEDEKPQQDAEPLRVLAFDTQSTCAQLFSKQLSSYLKLGQIHHPYVLAATLGPERIHRDIGSEHTRQLWHGRAEGANWKTRSTTYQVATNDLLRKADKIEQKGQTVFITEYAPFIINHDIMASVLSSQETIVSRLQNPTTIPDDLLKLFTPIIFISHPALIIPAWFRLAKAEYGVHPVDGADFTVWTSLRWSRMLFDYLRNTDHLKRQDSIGSKRSSGRWEPGYVATRPFVIDSDDVANNTHAMVAATCRLLGLDYKEVGTSWLKYFERAASTVIRRAMPAGMMTNFSERILGSQPTAISLDAETAKWRAEFGADAAGMLRRKVDQEMVHYKYLQNFKVRVLPSLTTAALVQNITGVPGRRNSAVWPSEGGEWEEFGAQHPLRIIQSAIERPISPRRESDWR
ncbi:uncharacterized protein LTR77_002276 [Saxophila tyrrhenica]|uniref:Glycosyltransferase n=1 Tax=Saxophila tyrrhenica TaxID=1690608 RepID=A0AAV9PLL0_9PEZI|nr:hypothetical protein LTR77_002276 [Saxophila tyrrhenica]